MEQSELFGQNLRNVEIFRSGKWKGDEYTIADLDRIAESFGKVGYDVPVKLGHSEEVGEPAYGWVESVSRIGDRLVADLRDLPDKIYDAIVNRQYDAVSSEIFLDLERNGEMFPAALKAVALLGAETPAVAGLKPLRDSLRGFSEAELAGVRTYSFSKEAEMAEKKIEEKEDNEAALAELKAFAIEQTAKIEELEEALLATAEPSDSALEVKKLSEEIAVLKKDAAASKALAIAAEIDRKVEAIKIPAMRPYASALYAHAYGSTKTMTFKHEDKTSEETAVAVLDHMYEFFNAQSEKMFKEIGIVDSHRDDEPRSEDAGVEVDRLVKLALAKGGHKSYTEAMKAVLSDPANTELKRAFAR